MFSLEPSGVCPSICLSARLSQFDIGCLVCSTCTLSRLAQDLGQMTVNTSQMCLLGGHMTIEPKILPHQC